jgi:membrane-associated phospholipid phosphatase
LNEQLRLLVELQAARADKPYPAGRRFGHKGAQFRPTPISCFLQLQPVPFGTVFNLRRQDCEIANVLEQHLLITEERPIVESGQELARIFENEAPGLLHRHALNWALFNRADISPPRQARIWMALDMAIYTALTAAWNYKWLHPEYSRLLRPEEYDSQENGVLDVLFDRIVDRNGRENGAYRECPQPTPGTPRHPAWPSGHSTYSAAASYILEFFFSPDTLGQPDKDLFGDFPSGCAPIGDPRWIAAELRRLANNIGEARLWGGVHWLSDHLAGQKIGRAAGEAVAGQFRTDCTPPVDTRTCLQRQDGEPPADRAEIEALLGTGADCTEGHNTVPPREDRGGAFLQQTGVT